MIIDELYEKNYDYLIGIDPGKSGAMAVIDCNGAFVDLFNFPVSASSKFKSQPDLEKLALRLTPYQDNAIAIIEKVGAMPTDGRATMWSFAENYGVWLGLLGAFTIPPVAALPQHWKAYHRLLRADKEASRQKAIELFPEAATMLKRKKDHNRAEALLIAGYGIQILERNALR